MTLSAAQQISPLELFSQRQLAHVDRSHLTDNSTHVSLCVTFILGASDQLEQGAELRGVLMRELEVSDRAAAHLVDTSQRLIRKYPYIDAVYRQGRQAAASWQAHQGPVTTTDLQQVLTENRSLTLMELEAAEVEAVAAEAAQGRQGRHRRIVRRAGRILLLILALIALAAINYVIFRN